MNLERLQKKFRGLMSSGRHAHREFVSPAREWLLGLLLGALVFLSGSAAAGYLFLTTLEEIGLDQVALSDGNGNFSIARLNEALHVYREKESRFNSLREEHVALPLGVVLPSEDEVREGSFTGNPVAE